MTCTYNCKQGRECYEPWACAMHRVLPPITKEGGATVEFEEARPMPITLEDEPFSPLAQALFVAGVALVVGVVLLPFMLGAV